MDEIVDLRDEFEDQFDDEMETEIRFCPNCQRNTEQESRLFDPDDVEGDLVWTCLDCLETVDIVGSLDEFNESQA